MGKLQVCDAVQREYKACFAVSLACPGCVVQQQLVTPALFEKIHELQDIDPLFHLPCMGVFECRWFLRIETERWLFGPLSHLCLSDSQAPAAAEGSCVGFFW